MVESIEDRQDNSSNVGENPWQKMANEVLRQPQKESFPTYNESFEMVRGNFQKNYNAKVESLQKLKEQLATTDENDSRMVNYLTGRIDSEMSTVSYLGSVLKRMRLNDEEDLKKRSEILGKFSKAVDEVIPDGEPIVFHGVNNIETIKTIIESGGLKTPEERGVDFKSFATQIDVTAKKNIRTSCNFADAGAHSFLPYGGMFVFYPKEYEKDNVLSTGDGTEVYGGVEGVDLREERFVGLITTDENIDEMEEIFQTNGLDTKKIFTHEQFLEYCRRSFSKQSGQGY